MGICCTGEPSPFCEIPWPTNFIAGGKGTVCPSRYGSVWTWVCVVGWPKARTFKMIRVFKALVKGLR